jgi:phosphomannomutase
VEGLRYGYEEALGYCVDPAGVRDKDGISAALLVAELAATLRSAGRTLPDLLDDLAGEHGLHATAQLSVRVADLGLITRGDGPAAGCPPEDARRGSRRVGRGPQRGLGRPAADRCAALPAGGVDWACAPVGTEPQLNAT